MILKFSLSKADTTSTLAHLGIIIRPQAFSVNEAIPAVLYLDVNYIRLIILLVSVMYFTIFALFIPSPIIDKIGPYFLISAYYL